MTVSRAAVSIEQHCRNVIRACLNTVEERGDTYVAIHKDDSVECVVLVSMIRSQRILSVIVADRVLFSEKTAQEMYSAVNDLNCHSIVGWHSVITQGMEAMHAYRQCLWMSEHITEDQLMDVLQECIAEYTLGHARIMACGQ